MTKADAVEKLLAWARAQIGYHETGENNNKYAGVASQLYGWDINGQPWCDVFVDAAFISCFGLDNAMKMTYQFKGCAGAVCRSSASYYQQAGAFTTQPEPGDQVFYYYSNDINHTGIVESVSPSSITTIEGNSSDAVRRNYYSRSNSIIAGYGRPNWAAVADAPEEPPATKPDEGNLEADGIAGPDTWVAIAGRMQTVKFGSQNWCVTALQASLNSLGADLDADGEFGPLTQAALLKFQGGSL